MNIKSICIQITLFLTLFSFHAAGQNKGSLKNLDAFKYVYVADLDYSGVKDKYSLSVQTRNFFNSYGIPVIFDLQKYLGNPCEIMYVTVNNKAGSGAKVIFEIRNCFNEIVYSTSGHATNWVNNFQDNFTRSLEIITGKIKRHRYSYNPNLTPKLDVNIEVYSGGKFDINDEKTVRDYLNSSRLDDIEGIWNYVSSSGDSEYKLLIIKEEFNYSAYILETNTWWSPGERKAVFEPAAVNTVFAVKWKMGNKTTEIKSVASMEGGVLNFNLNENETSLYKMYPQFNGQNSSTNLGKNTSEGWAGNGSGLIISQSGHVITNYHVIENAEEIEVEFIMDGENQKFNAEIIQSDKVNDLAVIKIFDLNFNGLDEIEYNFTTDLSDVGTKVYAYGYPLALSVMGKEIKVTDGIISSKTGFDGDITTYQITAPIQGGNSGGPLFDDAGNLIGINSSGLRKDIADNVGYTIKSGYVKNLIQVLPSQIDLPASKKLESLPLTEQIKEISKYVVLIKVK